MKRQSISFTEPNDEWLKQQIATKEYTSKSEIINDLIRKVRTQQQEFDWIRTKIEKAERSGFTSDNQAQILQQSKDLLNE
ncbi:MAG TPA: CopG family transcriptional regulator [Taishania sp.]|nr:CopG family transcriptional regulator [Taishania sp.]HNS41953.1 CopG family transcriptional regulator [Taishania sp.]